MVRVRLRLTVKQIVEANCVCELAEATWPKRPKLLRSFATNCVTALPNRGDASLAGAAPSRFSPSVLLDQELVEALTNL